VAVVVTTLRCVKARCEILTQHVARSNDDGFNSPIPSCTAQPFRVACASPVMHDAAHASRDVCAGRARGEFCKHITDGRRQLWHRALGSSSRRERRPVS
jgi:hypothetical protein